MKGTPRSNTLGNTDGADQSSPRKKVKVPPEMPQTMECDVKQPNSWSRRDDEGTPRSNTLGNTDADDQSSPRKKVKVPPDKVPPEISQSMECDEKQPNS